MNSEIFNVIDMNERDLEKLSKTELIKMVEKLQKKAKKPKIVIVDDDNGQVPQPRKTAKHIPPRDPKTGRFVKIHPDRPKPTLPRLRDAKGRFVSRRLSEPVVQQPPIQIRENQKAQKPIGKPVHAPTIKNRAPKIEKLDQALNPS